MTLGLLGLLVEEFIFLAVEIWKWFGTPPPPPPIHAKLF